MYHILNYSFCQDYLKKRTLYRKSHFEHLSAVLESGNLLLGGATQEENPSGILIFKNLTKEDIKKIAENDPYVKNEVVRAYKITAWNIVVGSLYP